MNDINQKLYSCTATHKHADTASLRLVHLNKLLKEKVAEWRKTTNSDSYTRFCYLCHADELQKILDSQ